MDALIPSPPPPPNLASIASPTLITPGIKMTMEQVPEIPKSICTLFWLTLGLSLINLFNAYKATAAIYILNHKMSETGMLPFSTVTVIPAILLLPVVSSIFAVVVFFLALKIKAGSNLAIKLIIIISLLSYLSSFTFSGLLAYQTTRLGTTINNSISL